MGVAVWRLVCWGEGGRGGGFLGLIVGRYTKRLWSEEQKGLKCSTDYVVVDDSMRISKVQNE